MPDDERRLRSKRALAASLQERLRQKQEGMAAVLKRLEPVMKKLPAALASAGAPDEATIALMARLAATSPQAAKSCEPWFAERRAAIEHALAAADGKPDGTLRKELPALLGIPHARWAATWLLGGHVGIMAEDVNSTLSEGDAP